MQKLTLKTVGLILLSAFLGLSLPTESANAQAPKQRIKVSQEQESRMLGRILAAVEDLYGGYLQEARSRYEQIARDVEKYDYSQNLRWQAYDGYGKALLTTGDKKKAFDILARAVEEAKLLGLKETVQSIRSLAAAYAEAGNFAEAVNQYKAALAFEPRNYDVMLELGSTYRRAKLFNDARATYEKVIVADPQNANAYGDLGNVYLDQGDIEKAVALYERFASYSDDKEAAAKNFLVAGFKYHEKKDYGGALALYNRALLITPDNPLAYADIGWTKLEIGQTQEAIEAFEKALTLNPSKEVKEYARKGLKEARAKK